MTQKYTVLGASGFIGSHLVSALTKIGVSCYVPERNDEKIFKTDLGKVFYCIGLTNDYKNRPFDTVEAHVGVLNRILSKASFSNLIYLSSTRLYDGLNSTSESADLKINPSNPRHLYDLSKGLGENLCLNSSNQKASVVRLSSVYDENPKATGFIPDLLRKLKKERKFSLDSSSGIVRDYVDISDVTSGLIAVSNSENKNNIINLASGENISNQEIVDFLNSKGCSIKLERQSERENIPATDIKKLNDLGIKPVSLFSYLENFLKKYG